VNHGCMRGILRGPLRPGDPVLRFATFGAAVPQPSRCAQAGGAATGIGNFARRSGRDGLRDENDGPCDETLVADPSMSRPSSPEERIG